MYTLEGVSSVANFMTAYEETRKSRDSPFLNRRVFVVSKSNLFDVYFICYSRLKTSRPPGRESNPGRLHDNQALYHLAIKLEDSTSIVYTSLVIFSETKLIFVLGSRLQRIINIETREITTQD